MSKKVTIIPSESSRSMSPEMDIYNPNSSIDRSINDADGRGVKQRLAKIDAELNYQYQELSTTRDLAMRLAAESEQGQDNLTEFGLKLKQELDLQLKEITSMNAHRYQMQQAENSRLQASIAALKADNSQLNKKMAIVLQRLEFLEGELDSDRVTASLTRTTISEKSTARPKTTSDLL